LAPCGGRHSRTDGSRPDSGFGGSGHANNMSSSSLPDLAASFEPFRRRLLGLAYRMLGSVADAEDAVQETYLRWHAMSPQQRDAIESPGGWLTTVARRVCL